TALLFEDLTQDRVASVVGAVVATFPTARLHHLAHLQLQFTVFWPLALMLIHRVVQRPTGRSVVLLALCLAAAPLASMYYGMFMAFLLPPFAFAVWALTKSRSWKSLAGLGAAALGAGILVWPIARVYIRALRHLGQTRESRTWTDLAHYVGVSCLADL